MQVAGSLQPPCPFVPTAATRNQYLVPGVKPFSVARALVDTPACAQLVADGGSGLFSIT